MKLLLQVFLAVALASVANAEVVGEITLAGQTVYVWKQGALRFQTSLFSLFDFAFVLRNIMVYVKVFPKVSLK